MKYGIRVKYFYYFNTLNRPKDGWLEVDGEIGRWATRKSAQEFIDEEDNSTYYLNHGEDSRRDLKVRKFPIRK